GPAFAEAASRRQANFFEHSLSLMLVAVLKHLWSMNMKYSTGPIRNDVAEKSSTVSRHLVLLRAISDELRA
ncbi:MAG: hypothetical protein O3A59_09560, partial [Nitrospirae bacterium]|nr:hypothetical protein [Nitrospirota bacterium]